MVLLHLNPEILIFTRVYIHHINSVHHIGLLAFLPKCGHACGHIEFMCTKRKTIKIFISMTWKVNFTTG